MQSDGIKESTPQVKATPGTHSLSANYKIRNFRPPALDPGEARRSFPSSSCLSLLAGSAPRGEVGRGGGFRCTPCPSSREALRGRLRWRCVPAASLSLTLSSLQKRTKHGRIGPRGATVCRTCYARCIIPWPCSLWPKSAERRASL